MAQSRGSKSWQLCLQESKKTERRPEHQPISNRFAAGSVRQHNIKEQRGLQVQLHGPPRPHGAAGRGWRNYAIPGALPRISLTILPRGLEQNHSSSLGSRLGS